MTVCRRKIERTPPGYIKFPSGYHFPTSSVRKEVDVSSFSRGFRHREALQACRSRNRYLQAKFGERMCEPCATWATLRVYFVVWTTTIWQPLGKISRIGSSDGNKIPLDSWIPPGAVSFPKSNTPSPEQNRACGGRSCKRHRLCHPPPSFLSATPAKERAREKAW